MTAQTLQTPAYDEYERGIIVLHQLSLIGEDGSAAADEIRDRLHGPWAAMTPEQRSFGNGVSADLFMLEPDEGEMYEPVSDEERSPERLGLRIAAATKRGDWSGLLGLLRKGPVFLTAGKVAILRARGYEKLGRSTVALAFARFARESDPTNVDVQQLEFELLARTDQADAVLDLAFEWVARRRPARLAVLAAGVLFRATQDRDEAAAHKLTAELVNAVREVIGSGELQDGHPDVDGWLGYARLVLGACLDRLGSVDAARQQYELILATPPGDPGDLAFRAALKDYVGRRVGSGPTVATTDQRTTLFAMTVAFAPPAAA